MEVCTHCEFKPVLQVLQDDRWSFMTNLANVQELVPETECNNAHGSPYKMLLRTIICYMMMETTAMLNYFPTKGGCQITSA